MMIRLLPQLIVNQPNFNFTTRVFAFKLFAAADLDLGCGRWRFVVRSSSSVVVVARRQICTLQSDSESLYFSTSHHHYYYNMIEYLMLIYANTQITYTDIHTGGTYRQPFVPIWYMQLICSQTDLLTTTTTTIKFSPHTDILLFQTSLMSF